MRLIDADALIEGLLEARHEETETTLKLVRFIRKQPTIEPERGRWTERQHFYNDEETIDEWQSERCSVCDKYLTTPYRYYFFHHNYCPYCGAKMFGKNAESEEEE